MRSERVGRPCDGVDDGEGGAVTGHSGSGRALRQPKPAPALLSWCKRPASPSHTGLRTERRR